MVKIKPDGELYQEKPECGVRRYFMFDMGKLGDISKMMGDAKNLQKKQEMFQQESLAILKKISSQMDEIIKLLKDRDN